MRGRAERHARHHRQLHLGWLQHGRGIVHHGRDGGLLLACAPSGLQRQVDDNHRRPEPGREQFRLLRARCSRRTHGIVLGLAGAVRCRHSDPEPMRLHVLWVGRVWEPRVSERRVVPLHLCGGRHRDSQLLRLGRSDWSHLVQLRGRNGRVFLCSDNNEHAAARHRLPQRAMQSLSRICPRLRATGLRNAGRVLGHCSGTARGHGPVRR